MEKLPRLSGKEVVKILNKIGFQAVRQRRSHVFLVKESPEGKRTTFVPMHTELDRETLLEIIRQVGLKREDFLRLV